MKMPAELHLPTGLGHWVLPSPWLRVRSSDQALLKLDGRVVRLRLQEVPSGIRIEHIPLLLQLPRIRTAETSSPPLQLVVSPVLSQSVRQLLEERETSYLDSKGHLHLVAPGVLVHLDGGPTTAVKRGKSPDTIRSGLGVHGVRTIQVLLEQQEPISVTELAGQASVSLGQAHKVLTQLELLGLIRAFGKGPGKKRVLRERTALLDWLEQQPSATRWVPSIDVAFYARRPEELWSRVSTRLTQAGIMHALTGAAAASLYGVGPTSVPTSLVRISPEVRLEEAARQLGAEITERGPNLTLLHDTGKVGCWHAETKDGIQAASPVRIYLDVRSERRGEDIARQFREVIIGY